jgi:hypothetical protein
MEALSAIAYCDICVVSLMVAGTVILFGCIHAVMFITLANKLGDAYALAYLLILLYFLYKYRRYSPTLGILIYLCPRSVNVQVKRDPNHHSGRGLKLVEHELTPHSACDICWMNMRRGVTFDDCLHAFHAECISLHTIKHRKFGSMYIPLCPLCWRAPSTS